MDEQPQPDELEQKVLQRVGATANVRLACQLRPTADLSVMPLLPAHRMNDGSVGRLDKYFWGVEQEITLMFADIRGFTQLSEQHLPYDVVFILNQYLANMSQLLLMLAAISTNSWVMASWQFLVWTVQLKKAPRMQFRQRGQ